MGEARVTIRAGLALAASLALAACADRLPVDAADHHSALPPARTYPEPVYTAPHAAAPDTAPPAAVASTPPADTCGAAALAYLVGKPRTEIPIPADMLHRRVLCSSCVVTQEFVPDRQTITYDTATGVVTKVQCG